MPAINKIHITGFKAFPKDFELELKGKHLLMYGENGSGKSSIYYALHCLFQSPLKRDTGKKYFDENNEQHLKNLNNLNEDSKIWIDFEGKHPFIYLLDKNGYNTTLLGGTHPLPANINGCFINHQFIFFFFNFRNSQHINLFPVFIKDILPFCLDDRSGYHIGQMYDDITSSIVKKGKHIDPTYIANIEYFNNAVKQVVENINIYASDIYNKFFKDAIDPTLQIRLRYDSNSDKPHDDPNEYWLKYDNIIERVNENNNIVERKSSYKRLNTPFIGLEITEIIDGGSRRVVKPQSYFNEAKLTAIALSIRFALLNLDKPADGRFLALDDMLISLDMSNRSKVVDFLLNISDRYKIYLFTHDRAFFEYFKHKSKRSLPSEWLYKEIYMNDKKEPYLKNSETYLGNAEHYIKQHEYEIAGNFLRKEAESFCKEFLPKKLHYTLEYSLLDLNGLICNCKKFAEESGMEDITLFDELDDYRKFVLNPSSHDSYDVVKYEHEVKKCFDTLTELRKIQFQKIFDKGQKVAFTLKTSAPNEEVFKFEITICDDFRLIIQDGYEPIISKGLINYNVFKNGYNEKGIQSDNTTLKRFYDVNYNKSDKSVSANFLDSIVDIATGNPIRTLL